MFCLVLSVSLYIIPNNHGKVGVKRKPFFPEQSKDRIHSVQYVLYFRNNIFCPKNNQTKSLKKDILAFNIIEIQKCYTFMS